jgi:hypothetical protein
MAKRKKRAATSRSSRKKRKPVRQRTTSKQRKTAKRRATSKPRTTGKRRTSEKARPAAKRRPAATKRRPPQKRGVAQPSIAREETKPEHRHRKTPSQLTKLSNAPECPSIPDLNNRIMRRTPWPISNVARIFRRPRAAYSGSYRIGASERLHSNLPSPVLTLKYPKPMALNGLVFDGDRIVSRCPYAIVAAQFEVLRF